MILAFLAAIAGLGAFAVLLHRLTVNALLLFIGLASGFAALRAGFSLGEAIGIGIAAAASSYALFVVLTLPGMPLAVQIGTRALFSIPAAAAGWHVAFSLIRPETGSGLLAYGFAATAAVLIGLKAWSSLGRTT